MFINYAHRGACAYAPENTMRAFRLGVSLGADGIETDIRKTKDGVPVLFHDKDMRRLTGVGGAVADLTFRELSALRVRSPDGSPGEPVPRLAEALAFIKETGVYAALELKEDGLEADVLSAIGAFGLREKSVVTSFDPARLRRVRALDPAQETGLLTRAVNEETLRTLRKIGAAQICPEAACLTPALVRALHGAGFSVRAWGVRDEASMRRVYLCGVDGMTVDFPDKLRALTGADTQKTTD